MYGNIIKEIVFENIKLTVTEFQGRYFLYHKDNKISEMINGKEGLDKYYKGDFIQSKEGVKDHVKTFSGHGEPFAMYSIDKILGESAEDCEDNEKAAIDYCTPHKERC